MGAEVEDLRRQLEGIAESLAELALDRLRESLEAGETAAPAAERRLTRARRAVEKAAALLAEDA